MKKILVTGGAGFIGSHLCKKLSEQYIVFSLDNYFTGSRKNHHEGVNYIKGDTKDINGNLEYIKPDMIYHLGEYSRVEQSYFDIEKVLEYNKLGTFAILEYVRKNKIRLLYAGSSTKFGDISENSSPYAWSKASNAKLVKNYGLWFNIDYVITYFYNVFGPGEISTGKYSTLIAKFIEKYKNEEKLTIVAPGTQKRNFTHIDDIIDGLMLVGKDGYGDGYGIGSDESYSILEIAEMFGSEIEMLPRRDGNRMTAEVLTNLTKNLGWSCKRNIKDYIKSIVNE